MSEPGPASDQECLFNVLEVVDGQATSRDDAVVVEEPVEIRLIFGPVDGRQMRSVSITMRTPGHDEELAAGFLYGENIVHQAGDISGFRIRGLDPSGQQTGNIVAVELDPAAAVDIGRLQRHFFTTSSCGVCGKASLDALEVIGLQPLESGTIRLDARQVGRLPDRLREHQATFARTGGLHAAGLVDRNGDLVAVREDVGRHNAVDKLVGRYFLDGKTPLGEYAMIVSGRLSFEILQKALVAGISLIVAVGAPSSLAVDLAQRYNQTIIGFASQSRFNVYSGAQRIAGIS